MYHSRKMQKNYLNNQMREKVLAYKPAFTKKKKRTKMFLVRNRGKDVVV